MSGVVAADIGLLLCGDAEGLKKYDVYEYHVIGFTPGRGRALKGELFSGGTGKGNCEQAGKIGT